MRRHGVVPWSKNLKPCVYFNFFASSEVFVIGAFSNEQLQLEAVKKITGSVLLLF